MVLRDRSVLFDKKREEKKTKKEREDGDVVCILKVIVISKKLDSIAGPFCKNVCMSFSVGDTRMT